jgi:hypothetical protein
MDSKSKVVIEAGIPIGDSRNSMTVGPLGPLLAPDRPSFSKD